MSHNELYVTPEATLVFPHLFEPKPIIINGQPQGDPLYSVSLLFDKQDLGDMKQIVRNLAQAQWPGQDLKSLHLPFRDGDSEADKQAQKGRNGEFYRGRVLVKASSKFEPGVVGPDKQDIIDPKEIYSGAIVRAQLNIKTFTAGVNKGVKCYLNHVMKTREGERLMGSSAQDAFSGITGVTTSVDPTGGAGNNEGDDDLM